MNTQFNQFIFPEVICVGEALKDLRDQDTALCKTVVDDCFESDDYKEGRAAFMEKRMPKFRGS